MTESKQTGGVRRKLILLVVVALVGFGLLMYYQRETLEETWQTLLDAKLGYVLLLPLLQTLNYFFIGNYYRKMFEQFGANITRKRSWGVVAAMNFVNQVLPSGGLSGITYLAYGFRAAISTGKTTLIQIGRYMFAFGSYAILLPFSIFLLVQNGRFDDLTSVTSEISENPGAVITLFIFLCLMGVVVASFFNRRISHVTGRVALVSLNWVARNVFRRKKPFKLTFLRKMNDDFHEGVILVREKGWRAASPGRYMLLSAMIEISIVYASLLAVGSDIGVGPVFLAFLAANIVGVVSVIPGDVGVHEATVILVLAAFGVDEPVAISATLLYRVFNKVIFLPVGFYFYTKILKRHWQLARKRLLELNMEDIAVSVSEFVALMNQTLEYAYPAIRVEGEISELRISKGRWVYFNLIDDNSSIRVFGTVYQLREAYEDGMRVLVKGSPRLHNKYGFSLNMTSIQPSGEGSIKKAFELVKKKLEAEGLFSEDRKRPLPKYPRTIGLITSSQAAAYSDFMKIVDQRWGGLTIRLANVNVQGERAPAQIVKAINYFSADSQPVDVLVLTRGGGGAEDLMAFSTEDVARAVAGSRVPTIVGVGHETDLSLADMAADVRATTPTNAAQLVVPDMNVVAGELDSLVDEMYFALDSSINEKLSIADRLVSNLSHGLTNAMDLVEQLMERITRSVARNIDDSEREVAGLARQLQLLNPLAVMERGFSLVADEKGGIVSSSKDLKKGQRLMIRFNKGSTTTEVIDGKQ